MKTVIYCILFGICFTIQAQTPQALLDSALVQKELKNYKRGIQFCEKAVRLDDTFSEAYFCKAGLHVALIQKRNAAEDYKNYKKAIQDYTSVLALHPKHAEAFFYRGGAHSTMGFLSEAIIDYQNSLKINSNQPKVYNSIAVSYAKLGNTMYALEYINKAVEHDNSYAKAYANRGNIYDMRGEVKKACADWKKAIELGYKANTRRYQTKCMQ